jgi:hypothetical protein
VWFAEPERRDTRKELFLEVRRMRQTLILIVLLGVAVAILSGCTTAGPFVSDVGYDGNGDLVITKNTVKLDAFLGVISMGENEQITVLRTPKPRQ